MHKIQIVMSQIPVGYQIEQRARRLSGRSHDHNWTHVGFAAWILLIIMFLNVPSTLARTLVPFAVRILLIIMARSVPNIPGETMLVLQTGQARSLWSRLSYAPQGKENGAGMGP